MKLDNTKLAQLERDYRLGKVPDWVYYQMNGRSAMENYIEIKDKQHKAFMEELKQRQTQKAQDKQMEQEIEKRVEQEVEKLLDGKALEKAIEKALDEALSKLRL